MNYYRLVILLFVVLSNKNFAEDKYQILKMNASTIIIDGKECKEGDIISEKSKIRWGKATAMRMRNVRTKKGKIITKAEMDRQKSESLYSFYLKTNRLSTRSYDDYSIKKALCQTHTLLDSLYIRIGSVDKHEYQYYISYSYDGKVIKCNLPNNNDELIFCRSMFEDESGNVPSYPIVLSVYRKPTNKDGVDDDMLTNAMIVTIVNVQ